MSWAQDWDLASQQEPNHHIGKTSKSPGGYSAASLPPKDVKYDG